MRRKPLLKLCSAHLASRYLQDDLFLLVYVSPNLVAIEHQKRLHRCMPYPFIPIHEWVIFDQRKSQRYRFRYHASIQFSPIKRHAGLSQA